MDPLLPEFAAHRQRLLDALEADEAVLLIGSPHAVRNADSEYRYRPDSDVYWLTGWEDPEVAVFLRPGGEPLTMFVQPRDPEREVWTGFRPGPEGAQERFGADLAHPYSALGKELPKLLQGVSRLHYAFGRNPDIDALLVGAIGKAAREARKNGLCVPETFHALSWRLHELRLRKAEDELAVLRQAAALTSEGFARAMALAAPGVPEYVLEAALEHSFRAGGGTGAGYTTIVGGGANATVLHYVTNRDPLRDGDLVLIDAGAEYAYYSADVTRTFPVSGRFSEPQRRVYAAVLRAQLASIEVCRPGATHQDVHDASVRVLTEEMVALGLIEGDVDDLIASEGYKKYYMHGTGHWLGLDVHDVGAYTRDGQSRVLEPGVLLTVEPGLYIAPDDADAPEELRGIGVRIEDDILITADGHHNLTAAIPKSIADVEAACAATV